ncbi:MULTISPECIES: globin [unclassified Corynebacterium]|uniref:globin n=1 Tax=unclassified Corynebacterium TaxID=2624378 RepID=UPI002168A1F9|nr:MULTISPECIES: globin [unclassified Corynebacterium]MCS4490683.1 globin [Corynebacterium sp. ES2775-CONJ]MCS4492485.1 globin [Corynebacterium sp. ES2715-CONJ3]MCS4532551.1 globin [Corynebacterium sp. ES2730-CONJ]
MSSPLDTPSSHTDPRTLYEAVGGNEFFTRVVRRFYHQVRTDDLIGPMYPADDFEGAEERLRTFLAQYWGGPTTYSDNRGHPRLRMRHAPFAIGEVEAKRWLEMMTNALNEEENLDPTLREAIDSHMTRVAYMLINQR